MKISGTQALGSYIRKVRKAQHLTLEEVANACGVGKRFLSELERGKPTVQLGKVLTILAVLRISLELTASIQLEKTNAK